MSARDVHPNGPGRAVSARLLAVALLAAALALILVLLAPDRDPATKAVARTRHFAHTRLAANPSRHHAPANARRPSQRPSPSALVTLAAPVRTRDVPTSFLGLSTEYWTLPLFERYGPLLDRALSLFEGSAGGPLVLRIGGDSADHTFWRLKRQRPPGWVVDLGPQWLNKVGALVQHLDARVILDLNLVTDTPLTAARWAGVAYRAFPRGSLVGFEVGNEPDLYARRYWTMTMRQPALAMTVLPKDISPAGYARDFTAYSRTLAQVAPGVPLVGPAAANPASHLSWVSALLASSHPRLGMVSGHVYPYSACTTPRRATYPTIPRVLSENASAGIAERLRPAIELAHRHGLPFRLTEINSVTCGGKRGVSDTFATALWAPDALFELLRAGVDGVNVHVRARAVNAAFSLGRRGMIAQPLLYGLMLFDRALGRGGRLVPVRLDLRRRARRGVHLKVWAVRVSTGGLNVLLLDKGTQPVTVRLRVPAAGPAAVERLLAPSVYARAGVTLAGQQVGPDARWHGQLRSEAVWPGRNGYAIRVPRMSAALVQLRLASSANVGASGETKSADVITSRCCERERAAAAWPAAVGSRAAP